MNICAISDKFCLSCRYYNTVQSMGAIMPCLSYPSKYPSIIIPHYPGIISRDIKKSKKDKANCHYK